MKTIQNKVLTEPAELFREWVHAMESGKYRQTRHMLIDEDADGNVRYCAMGLLYRVAGMPNKSLKGMPGPMSVMHNSSGRTRELATKLLHAIDIRFGNSIAYLNDHSKLTLPQIADICRQARPDLFEDEEG